MGSSVAKLTRTSSAAAPPLTGQISGTAWANATVFDIDQYPWYAGGVKQATQLRVLYDKDALYLQYQCVDKHIDSQVTQLNGSVCIDSAVELFATTNPGVKADYFNLEMNACGVFLMQYGPSGKPRTLIPPALAAGIKVVTSVPGPTKDESPTDNGWWVAAKVPWTVIGGLAGTAVKPTTGTVWRINAYRCGGKTDPQFAAWKSIVYDFPSFHRPEFFGQVMFNKDGTIVPS